MSPSFPTAWDSDRRITRRPTVSERPSEVTRTRDTLPSTSATRLLSISGSSPTPTSRRRRSRFRRSTTPGPSCLDIASSCTSTIGAPRSSCTLRMNAPDCRTAASPRLKPGASAAWRRAANATAMIVTTRIPAAARLFHPKARVKTFTVIADLTLVRESTPCERPYPMPGQAGRDPLMGTAVAGA